MKPNPHPVASSVRKRFQDFFEKPNTSSGLGFARYGGVWDFIKGNFRVNDSRAITDDSPEEYPQTTITMPKADVDVYLYDIDNGSAASLWVTDSGNWFAVGIDQHPVDCNCEVDTECNRWNGSNITGWTTFTEETGGRNKFTEATGNYCFETETGGRNENFVRTGEVRRTQCSRYSATGVCMEYSVYYIDVYNSAGFNAPNFTTTCNTNFSTRYNAPNFTTNRNIDGYNANECNRWNEFTFNCETCYPQWIRLLQSVNGTVTTIFKTLISDTISIIKSPEETLDLYVQDGPVTNFVKSMIAKIRGSEIEVTPYSDPDLNDKIVLEDGEIIYNPTGAQIEPRYGIMVSPSEYNQKNFIGGFQVIRDDY